MKPRIYKLGPAETAELFNVTQGWRRVFSRPGRPTTPMASVVHQPCRTWQDAIKACEVWHRQRELFEAVAARREEKA